MYMMALAGLCPSALLDWNNNYGSHPDKCVCFPTALTCPSTSSKTSRWTIRRSSSTVGKLVTFGTCVGRVKAGAVGFARYSLRQSARNRARIHRREASLPTIRWKPSAARGGGDSAIAETAEIHLPRIDTTSPPTSVTYRNRCMRLP